MRLSEANADDLLSRVIIAALYYDGTDIDPDDGVRDDLEFVMGSVTMVDMAEGERDQLRMLCGRSITDPTSHRRPLLDLVLGAVVDER